MNTIDQLGKMRPWLLFCAILVTPLIGFGQSNSVEIWMRAFIPNSANAGGGAEYIKELPNGSSRVKLLSKNSILGNICFSTDNRGFSIDPNVSSRLETKFTLTLNGDGTGKVNPAQNRTVASVTRRVNCDTGALVEQKMGSVDQDNIGVPAVADGIVQVIGQVQGKNLLTPLGSNGPSIDYSFDFQWKPSTSTLIADLTIGSFPAFELYARRPNGKWVTIIKNLPIGSPWQLGGDSFGINSSRIVETKIIGNLLNNTKIKIR